LYLISILILLKRAPGRVGHHRSILPKRAPGRVRHHRRLAAPGLPAPESILQGSIQISGVASTGPWSPHENACAKSTGWPSSIGLLPGQTPTPGAQLLRFVALTIHL